MTQKNTRRMTTRGNSASFNTKENSNNKEVYTDGLKSTGRKVGFVAVFSDITRREALSEKASIYTVEMTVIQIAMREIQK